MKRPPYAIEGVRVSAISDQLPNPENAGRLKVLLVEDRLADADLIVGELRRDGFVITAEIVQSPDQFRQPLRNRQYRQISCQRISRDQNLGGTE